MNQRWSQNPYAAFRPHLGTLANSGIRYENGAPTNFAARSPQVGIVPPFFNLNPAPQPNPSGPVQPGPAPTHLPPPSAVRIAEVTAAQDAIAKDAAGDYAGASTAWHSAAISAATQGDTPLYAPTLPLGETTQLLGGKARAALYQTHSRASATAATSGGMPAPAAESGSVLPWLAVAGLGLWAAVKYLKVGS